MATRKPVECSIIHKDGATISVPDKLEDLRPYTGYSSRRHSRIQYSMYDVIGGCSFTQAIKKLQELIKEHGDAKMDVHSDDYDGDSAYITLSIMRPMTDEEQKEFDDLMRERKKKQEQSELEQYNRLRVKFKEKE